jgi:hypothetical protein
VVSEFCTSWIERQDQANGISSTVATMPEGADRLRFLQAFTIIATILKKGIWNEWNHGLGTV